MPLIWTDDFESYTAGAAPTAPWTADANSKVLTAQAHGGTKSLGAGTGGTNSNALRPLGSSVSQWYADFWMWTNPVGATAPTWVGIQFGSGNRIGISITQDGAGKCGLWSTTTWFSFSVTLSAWHHYILEVTSAVAGTAKLTVDAIVAGTYSGDTRDSTGNAYIDTINIAGVVIGPSPTAEFFVDDLSMYSGVYVAPGGSAQARAMVLA